METITLRMEPILVMELFDDSFKIINDDYKSEAFVFHAVDFLRISKRINWFVTALSIIIEFFASGGGNVYKEKDVLQFKFHGKPQKFSLKGCDMKSAHRTIDKINKAIQNS